MRLLVKTGDKISAEIETRLDNGHLGMKRLPFIIVKDYHNKVVAITDQLKPEDEGIIYRVFDLYELKAVRPNDESLEMVIEEIE